MRYRNHREESSYPGLVFLLVMSVYRVTLLKMGLHSGRILNSNISAAKLAYFLWVLVFGIACSLEVLMNLFKSLELVIIQIVLQKQ
jgi:hypothetical protein